MITTMQTKMDALTTRFANTNLVTNTITSAATNKTINPKTGRAFKRYCWTYGCCVHWGRHCPIKSTCHKIDAVFKDYKRGSDINCIPNRSRMAGGAVKRPHILNWLKSVITCYSKPLISSVAFTTFLSNHSTQIIAKVDSGDTFHFLKSTHRKAVTDIVELQNGPKSTLPNNETI